MKKGLLIILLLSPVLLISQILTNTMLNIERTTTKTMTYSIVNALGQEVVTGLSTSKTIKVNLTELPSDIYFLRIDDQLIKLIKQD